MKLFRSLPRWVAVLFLLAACASPHLTTLVEVARMDHNMPRDQLGYAYKITDLDVLNYSNLVKKQLYNLLVASGGLRYGASFSQTTLTALSASATILGWPVATASGLSAGSGFVSSLGNAFQEKASAQAYESALTSVQKAESSYYFLQLGGSFSTTGGKSKADTTKVKASNNIPPSDVLTLNGETLYYRIVNVLKSLDDAQAKRIPDLQTLKDAQGDPSTAPAPPSAPSPAASSSPASTPPASPNPSASP